MHCCPTFQKVPPEAVSVGPSERCGEPTTEAELGTDTQCLHRHGEQCVGNNGPGQICAYTDAQTGHKS